MSRESARRNVRGILWHVGAVLYGIAVTMAAFDAPRLSLVVLVWIAGAALLFALPLFRSRWRSTLVVALALPVIALALEGAVRMRFIGVDAVLHPARYRPDPSVFFHELTEKVTRGGATIRIMTPGADRWFKSTHVTTNLLGYRGAEFSAKAPGCTRAIVLGDSFTMGWGVPESRSYPRVLERLLRERRQGRCIEIVNLGFPSEMFGGVCERIRVDGAPLDPDFVMIGVTSRMLAMWYPNGRSGDEPFPLRSPKFARAAEAILRGPLLPYGTRPSSWLRRRGFAFQKRPRFDVFEEPLVASGLISPRQEPPSESLDEEVARRHLACLREIARPDSTASVLPVMIAYLRATRNLNDDPAIGIPKAFGRLVEEAGFTFVDTGLAFPVPSEVIDYILYPGDNHPNARAQATYARAIGDVIAPEHGGGILP